MLSNNWFAHRSLSSLDYPGDEFMITEGTVIGVMECDKNRGIVQTELEAPRAVQETKRIS